MPTQKKIDTVADLKDRIQRATLLASAEYRGLRVKEMVEMRRRLRESGIEVRVIKNTLLKLAAEEAGEADLLQIVAGPTALALTFGDAIEAAKGLAGYAQGAPSGFSLRGGYMDGTVLSPQDLRALVRIPPRPVLLAQIMGQMQSPLAGFVSLIDAPLRELSGLVQALLSELPGLIEARAAQLEATGVGVEEPEAPESGEEEQEAPDQTEPERVEEQPTEEQEASDQTDVEQVEEPPTEEQEAPDQTEVEPVEERSTEEQEAEPQTEEPRPEKEESNG
jgi:large subunit ribosomal protein L10